MAVGVEPMRWMAAVVQRKEMAVGKSASATTSAHIYHWLAAGMVKGVPVAKRPAKITAPNTST